MFTKYDFSEVIVSSDTGKHTICCSKGNGQSCEFVFPVGVDGFRDEWRVCLSAHLSKFRIMEQGNKDKKTLVLLRRQGGCVQN